VLHSFDWWGSNCLFVTELCSTRVLGGDGSGYNWSDAMVYSDLG
jgi:hypothetical protein